MDRVQLTKYESTALGGDDADTLPYPAPIDAQEDAIEAAGLYLQDVSNRDETALISRSGNDMTFKDASNAGGLTLSQLVRSVSKVGTPANDELAVWTGDGTIEGESTLTFTSPVLSAPKLALTGPIRMTEVAASDGDTAGTGQIWVKDNTPNDLYFTDDTGVDHLVSLTETDYAKLAGRAGGQTLQGGTEASQDLTLVSTASATRGHVYLGAAQTSAFDETNQYLGIGIATPDTYLHVHKSSAGSIDPNAKAVLVIEAADHAYINFLGSATREQGIVFGEVGDSNTVGGIFYAHSDDSMTFTVGGGTTAAVFDSSGNMQAAQKLMVGTSGSVADTTLHVWENTAGAVTPLSGTAVTIESNAATYLSFLTPNTVTAAGILFGDPEDNDVGSITYNHATNVLSLTDGTTGTKTLAELAEANSIDVSGTPAINQLAIWNDADTLRGENDLTFDGTNLVVGNTTAAGKLHVYTSAVRAPSGIASDIVIEQNGFSGMSILSGSTSRGSIYFGDAASATRGGFEYDHTDDELKLQAASSTRVIITSTGLAISTAAPEGKLHIKTGDSGVTPTVQANELIVESNFSPVGMQILGPADSLGHIYFGDAALATSGELRYDHSTDTMSFRTGATERVFLSGNQLWLKDVGTGASALTNGMSGVQLSSGTMSAASKYTPALKFMTTDANLTTENPKLGALIVGRATETYGADTDGGMAMDFYVTADDPGTTSVPDIGMTLAAVGSFAGLGINETAPLGLLHVKTSDTGVASLSTNTFIVLESVGSTGMTILSGTSGAGVIAFGDSGDQSAGEVRYVHNGDYLRLDAGGTEKARIGGDANVHVQVANGTVWVENPNSGSTGITNVMPGMQLSSTGMDTTNKYTAALKFMSTDASLTTENPKLGAVIVGRATEAYAADTDGGMAIDFAVTADDPGTTNVPAVGMSLTAAGLGVGETSPLGTAHIKSADVGTISPSANADDLVIENSSEAGLTIYSGSTSSANLYFANEASDLGAAVIYEHSSNLMRFYVQSGDRASVTGTYFRLHNIPLQFGDATTTITKSASNLSFTDAVAGTKTLSELAAGGGVSASGTPVDNQLAVWTDASTIEGDANLTWDASTLAVGAAAVSPYSVGSALYVNRGSGEWGIVLEGDSTNQADMLFYRAGNAVDEKSVQILMDTGSFDIRSLTDVPAARFTFLAGDLTTGYVGIGTPSPTTLVDIEGATPIVTINATSGSGELLFQEAGADRWSIRQDTVNDLHFDWAGATKVTLDGTGGSGYVGIGTTSPDALLHVEGAADPVIWLEDSGAAPAALSRTMSGVQLSTGTMGADGLTPAIKFMSTDASLTTENPKLLAAIWGYGPGGGYTTDTNTPMGIRFGITNQTGGASTVPDAAFQIHYTGSMTSTVRNGHAGAVQSTLLHEYGSHSRLELEGLGARIDINSKSDATTGRTANLYMFGARNTATNFGQITFKNYDTSGTSGEFTGCQIEAYRPTPDDGQLQFETANNKTLGTRMTINNLGHIGVNGGKIYNSSAMEIVSNGINGDGIYIDTSGNVGVNVDPTARFHVHEPNTSTDAVVLVTPQTTGRDSYLYLAGDSTNTEGMYLQWDGSANDFYIGYRQSSANIELIEWNSGGDQLIFRTDLELYEANAVLEINGRQTATDSRTATLVLQGAQNTNDDVFADIVFRNYGSSEIDVCGIRGVREGTTSGRLELRAGTNGTPDTGLVVDGTTLVGVGENFTDPETTLHVYRNAKTGSSSPRIRLSHLQTGGSSIEYGDNTYVGVELMSYTMDTTTKYTPALKFMSNDASLGGDKYLAGIVGKALQTFSSSSSKGTAIELVCCQQGSTAAPQTVATFHKQASGQDYEALELEGAITLSASESTSPANGTIEYDSGFNFRDGGAWVQFGTGDVSKVGTPVAEELAVWTGDGTLQGESNVIYDTSASALIATATIQCKDTSSEFPVDATQGIELSLNDSAVSAGDYFPAIKWMSNDSSLTTDLCAFITARAEIAYTSNTLAYTTLMLGTRGTNGGILGISTGGVYISSNGTYPAATFQPDAILHVRDDAVTSPPTIPQNTVALFEHNADDLYFQLMGTTSQTQHIRFGDASLVNPGAIKYDHSTNVMTLDATTELEFTIGGTQDMLGLKSGGAYAKRPVEDSTAVALSPHEFDDDDSWRVMTNRGATSRNHHDLPSASAGWVLTFCCVDSDGIRINAATGDTIRLGSSVSGSGGYIETTGIGDCVTLVALDSTEWFAISYIDDNLGWTVS